MENPAITAQAAPTRFNAIRRHGLQIGLAAMGVLGGFAAHSEKASAEQCITLPTGVILCHPDTPQPGDPTVVTPAPAPEQPAPAPAPVPEEPTPPHHQPNGGNHNSGRNDHPNHGRGPNHHQQTQPEKNHVFGPNQKVSFDQCGWGGALGARMCGTGCGPTALADVLTDMTRYNVTPPKAARMLGDKYYVPGSGTKGTGFAAVGKRFGLQVREGNIASTKRALESGGVAVALFDNATAVERSGDSSSVAVNAHYVVLDGMKKGKFTMADPHKGSDRHNERTRGGRTRYWTVKQMNREGLVDLWAVTK